MAYCPRCGTTLAPGSSSCGTCGQPVTPASPAAPSIAAPAPAPAKKSKTPWIIAGVIGCGCLSIPVLGIVAAIVIPNYVDALEKGRTKRTMADLQVVNSALVSYLTDHAEEEAPYPPVTSFAELESYLVPNYLSELPLLDGWKKDFVYQCWNEEGDAEGCTTYRLASRGRDGVLAFDDLSYFEEGSFDPSEFDEDIVVGPEGFVRSPRDE